MACELELWQEAFRSVEDIQGLAAIGKKPPKPQFMATYYAKLTRIFTVSDSHLYNGWASQIKCPTCFGTLCCTSWRSQGQLKLVSSLCQLLSPYAP